VSAQRSSWREKKRDASKEAWRHDAIHCGNFYGGQRSDRRGERRRGTPPKKHEDMMLYIAATSMVVSAAIVVEREEEGRVYKVQRPVYYISEVLSDSKIWYPHV
jgi:hypothetical protein